MWRAERPLTEIPHSEFRIPHCLMYIELHCHSAFSFLDGASLPEQLALTASQLGYPALALTDHNGLYGSMAFAQEAKQLGLQAIIGAELNLLDGSHVTLLAETPEGYANLCRLITEAHLGREDRRDPRLEFASLEARHAGLIVLSGCRNGLLPGVLRRDGLAAARRFAERCRAVFGKENFVVELQRNHVRGDLALTRALKDVADSARLGVVASSNVHYHRRERHRLHDVLVAIRHRTTLDGSHDVRHANSEFFLRPPEEVEALFPDCPDAVAILWPSRSGAVGSISRGIWDIAFPTSTAPSALPPPGRSPSCAARGSKSATPPAPCTAARRSGGSPRSCGSSSATGSAGSSSSITICSTSPAKSPTTCGAARGGRRAACFPVAAAARPSPPSCATCSASRTSIRSPPGSSSGGS